MKPAKLILFLAAAILIALPGLSQAYTWYGYGGHTYALTSQPAWWTNAEAEAVTQGGHLVSIDGAAEESWLQTTFGTGYLWIGFTDQVTEGVWLWTSGAPTNYINWTPGEPNNLGDEDYAVMNWSGVKWNDLSNAYEYYGVIEVAPAPLPGTLLLLASGLLGLLGRRRSLP
jgi:hypothetical protein